MELPVTEIVGTGVVSLIIVFALRVYFLRRFLRKKLAENLNKKIPERSGIRAFTIGSSERPLRAVAN